jgi:hypothetical protein
VLIGTPSIAAKGFSLDQAKNQEFYLSYQGKALQSSYDPWKEARDWADKQDLTPGPALILGDPLGYALKALKDRYPHHTILALSPFPAKGDHTPPTLPNKWESQCIWRPGLSPLRHWLMDKLTDRQILNLQTLLWPRSSRLLAPEIRLWTDKVLALAKERQSHLLQRKFFGPRILNNILRQDALSLNPHTVKAWSHPTLLLAAGPSLSRHKRFLQENQDRFVLAALSSSLRSVLSWGIQPDIVLSMDPGFASSLHLRYAPPRSLVFLPPSAYVQGFYRQFRLVPYTSGSLLESDFCALRGWDTPGVHSKGTVTLTAIDLLLQLNRGQTYVLGFDLTYKDLLSHSWPHNWSWQKHLESSRLTPSLGCLYESWAKDALLTLPNGLRTSPSLSSFGSYINHSQNYRDKRVTLIEPVPFPHEAFMSIQPQDIPSQNFPGQHKPAVISSPLPSPPDTLRKHLRDLSPENYPLIWRDYLCDQYFWSDDPDWRNEAQVVLEKSLASRAHSNILRKTPADFGKDSPRKQMADPPEDSDSPPKKAADE